MSKKQWLRPEADWLPIRQAVFIFGVAEGRTDADFYDKPFDKLTQAEIVESSISPFSLRQLTTILEQKSGAHKAEINPTTGTFSFEFADKRVEGGPPWAILERPEKTSGKLDAVRNATGLVWRQIMLRAFDRAVSAEAVMLYARMQAASAPFERLPADVWPVLNVADWQNGVAIAPDRTAYWSIHVAPSVVEQDVPVKRAGSRWPQRELALRAIKEIYPNSIPDTEPNSTLCAKVGKWLKDHGIAHAVSDDTILRAAHRRK
jgi:hypothetical protein